MRILARKNRRYMQHFYRKEDEFEAIAQSALQRILSEFWVLGFKPKVLGDEGIPRRPDLVLIDKRYRMWTIVEVELSNHSLDHHVYPQMQALATGNYKEEHAMWLVNRNDFLDKAQMIRMVQHKSPSVMVLVNSTDVSHKWSQLKHLCVELAYLETFRNVETGDDIFSYSGYEPKIEPRIVAKAKHNNTLRNTLFCKQIADQKLRQDGEVQMCFNQTILDVRIIPMKNDECLLQPKQTTNFTNTRNYNICVTEQGDFLIVQL